ncbi:MAG: hypothetical protein ACPGVD_06020 [Flavobacteriales bacterium]
MNFKVSNENNFKELPVLIQEKSLAYLDKYCSGEFRANLVFMDVEVVSDSTQITKTEVFKNDTLTYTKDIENIEDYFEVDSNAFLKFCFKTSSEKIGIAPFGISFWMKKNGEIIKPCYFSKYGFMNNGDKIIPISKVHDEIEKRKIDLEGLTINLIYSEKENTLFYFVKKSFKYGLGYESCFPSYKQYFKMDALFGDVTEYNKYNENYFITKQQI